MGICPSKFDDPYKNFPEINEFRELFNCFHLQDVEIGKIYKSFKAIDCRKTGFIDINEIYLHLHMEKTFFNKRIFSMMDASKTGKLNFGEFLVGLWNYCSLEDAHFDKFAFHLYDKNNNGYVDLVEAQLLMKDIFGEEYEKNPRAVKVYQKLKELDIVKIDFEAFKDFTLKHPAMLYPAFALQHNLKKRIMGAAFWKKQAATRLRICRGEYMSIQEIAGDLMDHLKDKKKRKNSDQQPAPSTGRRGSDAKKNTVLAGAGGLEAMMSESGSRRRSSCPTIGTSTPPQSGRRGSKVLTPGSIESLQGQELYHKLISGKHQDKKPIKEEGRRHSRDGGGSGSPSSVHPLVLPAVKSPSTPSPCSAVRAAREREKHRALAGVTRRKPPEKVKAFGEVNDEEEDEVEAPRVRAQTICSGPTVQTSTNSISAVDMEAMQEHVKKSLMAGKVGGSRPGSRQGQAGGSALRRKSAI